MKLKKYPAFFCSQYMLIAYVSLLALVLHLIAIQGFGYFRDELYYIACSQHIAFGYVDHPPFSILLLKLIRAVFGDSLVAIRILPVLCSAILVFVTGLIAKELGGGKFAMVLAAVSGLAPIGNFFLFGIYSMNFLDHMFWLALMCLVLQIIKTGKSKYWLWFGLVAGLGLQNKISVLFLVFGIAVGVLLTPERKQLKNLYLWGGAVVAIVLFIPYILWNIAHQWPLLEFMNNAKLYKMSALSPLEFLKEQILITHPVNLLVCLAGLWFFFFSTSGQKYRLFGWMYLAIYVLFTFQQAKPYYLTPVYPILFAGGAVMLESLMQKKFLYWLRPLLVFIVLVTTLILVPLGLPILSQENTIKWIRFIGVDVKSGENHQIGLLPQHFADMNGWPEMVEKVAAVYNTLSSQEKKECFIFGQDYGQAGAVDFFGKTYHLPPAFSGHNNYYFWPPRGYSGNVVIMIGGQQEDHQQGFMQVKEIARTSCQYAMPFENHLPIFLCRGIQYPLEKIWPTIKKFE